MNMFLRGSTAKFWKFTISFFLYWMNPSLIYSILCLEKSIANESRVVGGWHMRWYDGTCSDMVGTLTSALSGSFVSKLRLWELNSEIWAKRSRSWAWQLVLGIVTSLCKNSSLYLAYAWKKKASLTQQSSFLKDENTNHRGHFFICLFVNGKIDYFRI